MIIIGSIIKVHGLTGNIKFLMKYPYSIELIKKYSVFDSNLNEFYIENVFGIVKNVCIIKFKEIDSIESAKKLCKKDLYINLKDKGKYSCELIGFSLFRSSKLIGKILDVLYINGVEYIETEIDLITFNQIKEISYTDNSCFI